MAKLIYKNQPKFNPYPSTTGALMMNANLAARQMGINDAGVYKGEESGPPDIYNYLIDKEGFTPEEVYAWQNGEADISDPVQQRYWEYTTQPETEKNFGAKLADIAPGLGVALSQFDKISAEQFEAGGREEEGRQIGAGLGPLTDSASSGRVKGPDLLPFQTTAQDTAGKAIRNTLGQQESNRSTGTSGNSGVLSRIGEAIKSPLAEANQTYQGLNQQARIESSRNALENAKARAQSIQNSVSTAHQKNMDAMAISRNMLGTIAPGLANIAGTLFGGNTMNKTYNLNATNRRNWVKA